VLSLLLSWSCDRPERFQTGGSLGFSRDTVKFDTIFSTVASPTERLYMYNTSGNHLRVKSISLAKGDRSPFRLIVDGVSGQAHSNVEFAKGDSIWAFFNFQAEVRTNTLLTDSLVIRTDNATYQIPVVAKVLDVNIVTGRTLSCDTVFTKDKPIMIDGVVTVSAGCTLRINAGSKLYFTARRETGGSYVFLSRLQVKGTLLINPEGGDSVVLTNFRLNNDYQESAGQWEGVVLTQESRGNWINKTVIKNGTNGVRVDSLTLPGETSPKLLLTNSRISNMSNFAILGLGAAQYDPNLPPAIQAYNVLAHNTGQSVVGMAFGGKYHFHHCTFYNGSQIGLNRTEPVVGINNFLRFSDSDVRVYSSELVMENCIIWGTNKDEFGFDVRQGTAGTLYAYQLNNNVIRTTLAENPSPDRLIPETLPPGRGNLLNQDPNFQDVFKRQFRPLANSPAKGSGKALSNLLLSSPSYLTELRTDINRQNRNTSTPTIGAFEAP
jgi:hypothetical protein